MYHGNRCPARQPVSRGCAYTGSPRTVASPKGRCRMMLLGLCIVFAICFTVAFNIISRLSLSTTRHEAAYTILWQAFCALLAPLFLPFDRFSIALDAHVLLPFALSIALWELVDAFMF